MSDDERIRYCLEEIKGYIKQIEASLSRTEQVVEPTFTDEVFDTPERSTIVKCPKCKFSYYLNTSRIEQEVKSELTKAIAQKLKDLPLHTRTIENTPYILAKDINKLIGELEKEGYEK